MKRKKIVFGVAALVAVWLLALLFYQGKGPSPAGKAGSDASPETLRGRPMQPAERPDLPAARYPADDEWGRPFPPAPFVRGPAPGGGTNPPEQLNPPDVVPGSPEAQTFKLPNSPTQVHSLEDAATVMGYPPDYHGIVGVPRTRPLPPGAQTKTANTDARPITAPLSSAGEVIGVPPGVQPDEVGKTKTQPLPADGKPPEQGP